MAQIISLSRERAYLSPQFWRLQTLLSCKEATEKHNYNRWVWQNYVLCSRCKREEGAESPDPF